MTPDEFAAARAAWGLTQAELAIVLKVSEGRTVRKWEYGERPIEGLVLFAMEALLSGYRPENWPVND